MCGFVGFTGQQKDPNILSRMLEKIAHRGPDAHDVYRDADISLGFRRLSIIDLQGGSQPLYNEDRTKVLVFNGEIYNYQSLREELLKKGHTFTTHSDSEVLIHGYEEYDAALLPKLRGMFAFAIWDSTAKKLFAARDFFGIKPFYYARQKDHLFFGSEIKSFLAHPDFKKELHEERLWDYLTFGCVPGNGTFFKDVFKLPPGHYLTFESDKLTIERYFTPEFLIDEHKNWDTCVETISKGVTESVKTHLISDVPVGCFLSSGVDSSYVAAELAAIRKVETYSAGFADQKYNEADHAQAFAKEIGLANHAVIISSEEYFANVGKVQYHLDEPLANPSANSLFFLSRLAGKDVKVVLSGEGADEMFGGYNVYKEPLALATYQKIPLFIRKSLAAIAGTLPDFKGKNAILRGARPIEERYIGNSNLFTEMEKESVLAKAYPKTSPFDYVRPWYEKVADKDDVTKMQYVDIHVWMVQEILLKADKMSMASSLELRVPFLDVEIFNIAKTIPQKYKVSKKNTKLAFRQAARKRMGDTNADRKKLAFPLPLVEWLREDRYYAMIRECFMSETAKRFFNQSTIMHLLDEHKSAKKNNARKIWAIYTFLVWYGVFFK